MAIHLLEQNQDKIDWINLSRNPKAIHLLEEPIGKMHWECLIENLEAIQLLKDKLLEPNQDKICVRKLLTNPAIFEIDYLALQERIEPFKEELMLKCFHPNRLVRYLETYNYDIGEDDYSE